MASLVEEKSMNDEYLFMEPPPQVSEDIKAFSKPRRGSSFYFDHHQSHFRSANVSFQWMVEKPELEKLPNGSKAEQFYSRPVSDTPQSTLSKKVPFQSSSNIRSMSENDPPIGSMLKLRKVPVKVDPKVAFANDRTFLLWLHSAVWLFGASLTILKFSRGNPRKFMYGCLILPIALTFIVYAIYQYRRRARMIKTKEPGPYEDIVGPVLFASLLMIAIVGQFLIIVLYDY